MLRQPPMRYERLLQESQAILNTLQASAILSSKDRQQVGQAGYKHVTQSDYLKIEFETITRFSKFIILYVQYFFPTRRGREPIRMNRCSPSIHDLKDGRGRSPQSVYRVVRRPADSAARYTTVYYNLVTNKIHHTPHDAAVPRT